MKKYFTLTLLLFSLTAFCQESFRKEFVLRDSMKLKGGAIIRLKKEKSFKINELKGAEKDSILRIFKLGDTLRYTVERTIPSGKVLVAEKLVIDSNFLKKLEIKKVLVADRLPASKGFVKFDEDKIWVNPNLLDFENQGLYYYQLSNRQSINLYFSENTVSALTLPLKYRFAKSSKDISEEFTTAVNVNFFIGRAIWGKTKFHYREKVGNITNTSKITIGGLVGASTVTLNKSNTSAASDPILDGSEITKGLASLGFGATYTFNKINCGLFYGYDFSIGDDASKWNYNKRPWFGIAIGYSLLPF